MTPLIQFNTFYSPAAIPQEPQQPRPRAPSSLTDTFVQMAERLALTTILPVTGTALGRIMGRTVVSVAWRTLGIVFPQIGILIALGEIAGSAILAGCGGAFAEYASQRYIEDADKIKEGAIWGTACFSLLSTGASALVAAQVFKEGHLLLRFALSLSGSENIGQRAFANMLQGQLTRMGGSLLDDEKMSVSDHVIGLVMDVLCGEALCQVGSWTGRKIHKKILRESGKLDFRGIRPDIIDPLEVSKPETWLGIVTRRAVEGQPGEVKKLLTTFSDEEIVRKLKRDHFLRRDFLLYPANRFHDERILSVLKQVELTPEFGEILYEQWLDNNRKRALLLIEYYYQNGQSKKCPKLFFRYELEQLFSRVCNAKSPEERIPFIQRTAERLRSRDALLISHPGEHLGVLVDPLLESGDHHSVATLLKEMVHTHDAHQKMERDGLLKAFPEPEEWATDVALEIRNFEGFTHLLDLVLRDQELFDTWVTMGAIGSEHVLPYLVDVTRRAPALLGRLRGLQTKASHDSDAATFIKRVLDLVEKES